MINIASSDLCLVADRFYAECKKKPIVKSDNSFGYERFVIILRESAKCNIFKECDLNRESTFIQRMKSAFKIVKTGLHETISVNLGELKCDNCEEPDLRNLHLGQHRYPPFKMERINQYPAISFINSDISSQSYVEAVSQIILL